MVTVKFQLDKEVRRMTIEHAPTTFEYLQGLSERLFKNSVGNELPARNDYYFVYIDEDNHPITVTNDDGVYEAFRTAKKVLFTIVPRNKPLYPNTSNNANASANSNNNNNNDGKPPVIVDIDVNNVLSQMGFSQNAIGGIVREIFNHVQQFQQPPQFQQQQQHPFHHPHPQQHNPHQHPHHPRRHRGGARHHPRIICDGCQVVVNGARFKCEQCPDYDLCDSCHAKNADGSVHAKHTFKFLPSRCPRHLDAAAQQAANGGAFVHMAWCDGCQTRLVGTRYKCEQCDDYDLCETCNTANQASFSIHPQSHVFHKMTGAMTPELEQHFSSKRASAAAAPASNNASPAVAPRVAIPLVRLYEAPAVQNSNDSNNNVAPSAPPMEAKVEPAVQVQAAPAPVVELQPQPPQVQPQVQLSNSLYESDGSTLFEKNLAQLQEMGFADRQRNIEVLVKTKNDLVRAIRDLCA